MFYVVRSVLEPDAARNTKKSTRRSCNGSESTRKTRSLKNRENSSKIDEKSWNFMKFHRKIMKNHKISSQNHENSWKFIKFDRKKQDNKTSTFYAFTEYLCSTEARFAPWCRTKKGAFWIRSLSIFGPLRILFFRFWNSMISRSFSIFGEKRSEKWCIFFPDLAGLGWAGAGLGWPGLSIV